MMSRASARRAAVCVLFALLVGCGDNGGGGGTDDGAARPDASGPAPGESRGPRTGTGSKDPDDVNGDGHRDLLMTVPVRTPGSQGTETRLAVVFGSENGLDPTRRTVYSRPDLGLPTHGSENGGDSATSTRTLYGVTTADLDGDGFPDFVTRVGTRPTREEARRTGVTTSSRPDTYVSWGGPTGPRHGAEAVRLRLPATAAAQGLSQLTRGDFDGDGHMDLAGTRQDGTSVDLLYGPFTRGGVPSRVGSRWVSEEGAASYGGLVADEAATSGKPRATGLFVHFGDDGEQRGGVLFAAGNGGGGGIAATGRPVRAGNTFTFGDFDGDGARDLAVGDNGSRNNEPGYETEPPEVDGSYAVYFGKGGAPGVHRLPKAPSSSRTFFAFDPDGDGRDGLLVAEAAGPAVLLDGEREVGSLSRSGPGNVDGRRIPANGRSATVTAVADFDDDGRDEAVVNWSPRTLSATYGSVPIRWWITDGLTGRDRAAFPVEAFARD